MSEQAVNELSTATPALTDYIMGMSGTAEYKALVSAVAKKIVEDYAGSSLAGSNQSVKSALDTLNSNFMIEDFMSDSVTISAGARQAVGIACVKSGYSAVGILGVYVQDTDIFSVNEFYIYSDRSLYVVAQNQYTEARTSKFRVTVLFKKNS